MTLDPIELLLLIVIVLDGLIIAGIVIARVAGVQSASRAAAMPVAPVDEDPGRDRFTELTEPGGGPAQTAAPRAEAPQPAPAHAGADGRPPLPDPAAGFVDAAEWRRALRRETARAVRYGRPATIMQLELDADGTPDRSATEAGTAESLLAALITTHLRSTDYVARTAPDRFHIILTETPESSAVWVAERIRIQYLQHMPDGPHLLIGWAGAQPQDDAAASLRRAGEWVHEDRRRLRAANDRGRLDLFPAGQPTPGQPAQAAAGPAAGSTGPAPAIGQTATAGQPGPSSQTASAAAIEVQLEGALTALERVWRLGLVTEEEYRAKRSAILSRL